MINKVQADTGSGFSSGTTRANVAAESHADEAVAAELARKAAEQKAAETTAAIKQDGLDKAKTLDASSQFAPGKSYTVNKSDGARGIYGIAEKALNEIGVTEASPKWGEFVQKAMKLIVDENRANMGGAEWDENLIHVGDQLKMPDIYSKILFKDVPNMKIGPGGRLVPADPPSKPVPGTKVEEDGRDVAANPNAGTKVEEDGRDAPAGAKAESIDRASNVTPNITVNGGNATVTKDANGNYTVNVKEKNLVELLDDTANGVSHAVSQNGVDIHNGVVGMFNDIGKNLGNFFGDAGRNIDEANKKINEGVGVAFGKR